MRGVTNALPAAGGLKVIASGTVTLEGNSGTKIDLGEVAKVIIASATDNGDSWARFVNMSTIALIPPNANGGYIILPGSGDGGLSVSTTDFKSIRIDNTYPFSYAVAYIAIS